LQKYPLKITKLIDGDFEISHFIITTINTLHKMRFNVVVALLFAMLAIAYSAPLAEIHEEDDSENTTDNAEIAAPEETPEEAFTRSDTDDDSSLTFNEFLQTELSYVQLKRKEFEMLDGDHDGKVTHGEYADYYGAQHEEAKQGQQKYLIELFKEFDHNNDKQLNRSEVETVLAKRFFLKPKANFAELFTQFDTNGDNALSMDEYGKFDASFPFYELEPLRQFA